MTEDKCDGDRVESNVIMSASKYTDRSQKEIGDTMVKDEQGTGDIEGD